MSEAVLQQGQLAVATELDHEIVSGLNPAQAEAVRHGDGPVLVFAGAGSGKTRVLTRRIAYLIQVLGRPAWSIMAVTFTNKAAAEMRDRVHQMVGDISTEVAIGTFHAICVRILRRESEAVGRGNFSIYDADDQRRLMKQAIEACQITDPRMTPGTALGMVSRLKNELIGPAEFAPSGYVDDLVAKVYPVYEDLLRRNNAFDFDDLLVKTVRLLQDHAEILEKYANRYSHVLVDEYQDTNHAQYLLVRMIASKYRNLFVVGDADQAIYGWRGADIRNILEFERHFPDAKSVTLDQNYRSTQNILDAAHGVIAVNEDRPPKRLWTDKDPGPLIRAFEARTGEEEAQFVAREIRRLVHRGSVDANSCAVMYRTNAQSRAIEDAFIREGVPYKIVGTTKFYERREIRDVLAYLRFLANPADSVSLERIVNVPPRKIGQTSLAVVREWSERVGVSLWDAINRTDEIEKLGPAARKNLGTVAGLFTLLREYADSHNVVDLLDHLLDEVGYLRWLETQDDGADRVANVEELTSVAKTYEDMDPAESLRAMLEQTALVSDADESSEVRGSAVLLTMHLAKGLEYDVVFLVGMEENLFPHVRALESLKELEEERRLCYVGITRARRQLYLTYAMSRLFMGRTHRNAPSRFLSNIPPALFSPDSILPGQEGEHSPVWGSTTTSFAAAKERVITEATFTAGEKVYHKHFGVGIILESRLEGGDEEVLVEFTAAGKPVSKRLSVLYSGIEHA